MFQVDETSTLKQVQFHKLLSFNPICVERIKDLELDPSRLLKDVSPLVLMEEFR